MLLSKIVMVRWNGTIRKWYEEKGYNYTKQGEFFESKLEDVQLNSTARVYVQCDYCNEEFDTEYRNYLKGRKIIQKDCCSNRQCMVKKSEEINIIKYDVKNHMQTQKSKDYFSRTSRENFDIVAKAFEDKGLKLISKEEDYKNDRSRLQFICTQHEQYGIQETNYQNVKNQKHCCGYGGKKASGIKKRLSGQKVYDEFLNQGLIPKFTPEEYIGNSQPLPYICKKHENKGIQHRRFASLKESEGCSYCANERTAKKLLLDEKIVFNDFKQRGLIIVEGEHYQGKEIPIKYYCPSHSNEIQSISHHGLQITKVPCRFCREENNLEKISRKIRSALSWWRKASRKNCNNRCILTGVKEKIEIHHQYQLDTILKEALNNLNIELKLKYTGEEIVKIKEETNRIHKEHYLGVCFNQKLHKCFHTKYGKDGCDKEMVNEFIRDYFNGEYDDILEYNLKSINSKSNYEEAMKMASFYYAEN
jgi:hypothetical protein